ncbi:transposable element Tcb1 transposase [Trichonephila clavipes]|nr:transposable element Tcb1 transposase [Trichonephila clavipes]
MHSTSTTIQKQELNLLILEVKKTLSHQFFLDMQLKFLKLELNDQLKLFPSFLLKHNHLDKGNNTLLFEKTLKSRSKSDDKCSERLETPYSSETTGTTTVSRQTVYRGLGHIGLYARRPVRCAPLTATHCRVRLIWSREHALWTAQQWSCVMFSNQSRFSLKSDSVRTLIWRAPGTRYHQENTIERHRYGGAGWLVWGGIIFGSRTDLHFQSVTMTGHIYRDGILEQHVRFFRGAMGAEFLSMYDNARPHRANIVDECLHSEDITRMDWPAYSTDLI